MLVTGGVQSCCLVYSRVAHWWCTGIIARNEADGTVYHARNLDFSFAKYLQAMTYNAVFVRGGKELFTAQMVAAYQQILTGIRRGSDGYRWASSVGVGEGVSEAERSGDRLCRKALSRALEYSEEPVVHVCGWL